MARVLVLGFLPVLVMLTWRVAALERRMDAAAVDGYAQARARRERDDLIARAEVSYAFGRGSQAMREIVAAAKLQTGEPMPEHGQRLLARLVPDPE